MLSEDTVTDTWKAVTAPRKQNQEQNSGGRCKRVFTWGNKNKDANMQEGKQSTKGQVEAKNSKHNQDQHWKAKNTALGGESTWKKDNKWTKSSVQYREECNNCTAWMIGRQRAPKVHWDCLGKILKCHKNPTCSCLQSSCCASVNM